VLLIREALGIDGRPVFAHLPLLVNAQRKKLSKRRDDVSVESYRERGYLPEAFRNYMAVLGWGPSDGVEVRPIEEIVELFRLEEVVSSAAFFDTQKLDHFNGEYIRALPVDEFTERARPWVGEHAETSEWRRLAPLVQERVVTLADAPPLVEFVFADTAYDEKSWEKAMVKEANAAAILDGALAAFAECNWDASTLHDVTLGLAEGHEMKLSKAQAPIRVAVMGRTVGLPLFESLDVLGREQTLHRLRRARERLAGA
jgi:glutamyl-tRNA synthetase